MDDLKKSQEYNPTSTEKKTIAEAITFLSEAQNKDDVEFILPGDVTTAELQALLDLRIEVAITEAEGSFILTSNPDSRRIFRNEGYIKRQRCSRLFLHTHHNHSKILVDTPSFADILLSPEISQDTLMFIAHSKGLIQFGRIKLNPLTGVEVNDLQVGSVINEYARSIGVNFSGRSPDLKMPFILDKYSPQERIQLAREFVRKSGMLIEEADWGDTFKVQKLMEVINSTRMS
jgi:hypothetical protein